MTNQLQGKCKCTKGETVEGLSVGVVNGCPVHDPLYKPENQESREEWDIGGDIAIQAALILDTAFPNKYSSSFLETFEQKVADMVNPKLKFYIDSTLEAYREEVRGKAKNLSHQVNGDVSVDFQNGYNIAKSQFQSLLTDKE